MEYYNAPQSAKPKRRRKWLIWLIILIALVVLIAIAVLWATSTQKATITQSGASSSPRAPGFKTYQSQYISLQYSDSYKQKSHLVQNPGVEQTLLRANTSYEKTLAIEVQPLPTGGIAGDSGFQYRQMHPELYDVQQTTLGGGPATQWSKKDGTEITIYSSHGAQYVVLSFSIANTNDTHGLSDEVAAVMQSFFWK